MHIFKPIKQIKASSEVGQQLKNAILGGDYKAGDKLPSERELIELFQVSRTVIREAIKSLEAGGLVEIRQGATGGAFVKHLTFERLSDACHDLFMMGKLSLPELCQARMLIEPQVARMAAKNCTPEQALILLEADRHENDTSAYPDTVTLRSQVHYLLAEMSGNRFLEAIVKSLLILLRNQTMKYEPPTDEIHPLGLHSVIVEAVVAKDEDKAEAEMLAHLEDFNVRLREIERKYKNKQA
ncbi:FadR family transcriptional regulator [Shewanella putrefaciens]|uniref:GntR domain protein n=2 Tax=Shewanella putrefaciens TaxID=24 RepID=E6XPW6_SHEP2|nr:MULTISPECIES: FadR/GntR family transcriptional regulator [Shewanella]CAD6364360.1 HTH-type transcriptional regulator LutR [Shewanella hafniensis]ABM23410.1 transcriptional regulator, GntR family [Shewanella sp. W3-18-1]AVV85129.1 GntR family transcriptional regulator [Shewanella putrefaciens]MCA1898337.1 FadR family transcriptional regulator [Shewanella putrefaciens]MCK7631485.1 FadR family transcriptional regulator [Shewanella sp. JNE9-1]